MSSQDPLHHLKVRLLFGLFEANATGTVAIGAAVLLALVAMLIYVVLRYG